MIGLINYGMGNLGSVRRTFEILNIQNKVILSPDEITNCEKLVLPGVGNFSNAMNILNNNGWSEQIVKHTLVEKKTYFRNMSRHAALVKNWNRRW